MKTWIGLIVVALIASLSMATAQVENVELAVNPQPASGSPVRASFAAGLGVPYGVLGGKLLVGSDRVTGELGLGIVPIVGAKVFSLSGSYHFRDPAVSFRPKVTLSYSSAAGVIAIIDGNALESLYDETFPGLAAYVGTDWRLGSSSFLVDMNLGFVFPFAGASEIQEEYEDAVADLARQGYVIESERLALSGPKLALGVSYSPRSGE